MKMRFGNPRCVLFNTQDEERLEDAARLSHGR